MIGNETITGQTPDGAVSFKFNKKKVEKQTNGASISHLTKNFGNLLKVSA